MTVINYCPKLIVSCRVVLCRLGVIWAISSAVARLLMFIEFVYIRFVRRAKVEVLYECLVFALWSFFRRKLCSSIMADHHFTIHNLPYGVFSTADNVRVL